MRYEVSQLGKRSGSPTSPSQQRLPQLLTQHRPHSILFSQQHNQVGRNCLPSRLSQDSSSRKALNKWNSIALDMQASPFPITSVTNIAFVYHCLWDLPGIASEGAQGNGPHKGTANLTVGTRQGNFLTFCAKETPPSVQPKCRDLGKYLRDLSLEQKPNNHPHIRLTIYSQLSVCLKWRDHR